MYIELKCKNCGKYFHIDFEEEEMTDNKCPNCGHYFKSQHLSHLAEVFYITQKHTDDIDLIGLSGGKRNIVFSTDIDNLNRIYNNADHDVQIQISRLLDILYLLVHREAKNGDAEAMNKIIAEVRRLYNRIKGNPEDFLVKENYSGDGLLGEFKS